MHEQKSFSVNNSKNNTDTECLSGNSSLATERKSQQYNNSYPTKPNLLTYQNSMNPSTPLKNVNGSEQNILKCFVCFYELKNDPFQVSQISSMSIQPTNPYFILRKNFKFIFQLLNESYCHRECFKCNKCEKFILDKKGYNIVDNKFIYW